MATVVLTQPSQAGIPGTFISGVEIPPLTTLLVDSCMCDNNLSLKWIYTLMDGVDEDVVTGEVVANHRYGTDPRWNRYGLVGRSMPHRVNVSLSGTPPNGTLELNITNNHPTNTYKANIVRIQMLS